MIKSNGGKTFTIPTVAIPQQESIVATIAAYINKEKTKDDALKALVVIEKQITKSG